MSLTTSVPHLALLPPVPGITSPNAALFAAELPRWLSQMQQACVSFMKGTREDVDLLQDMQQRFHALDKEAVTLGIVDFDQKFKNVGECLFPKTESGQPDSTSTISEHDRKSLKALEMVVESSPWQSLDEGLLQHVLGSHFGIGTKLEGYQPQPMVEYVLNVLERKIDALHANPLCDALEIPFCQTLGLRGGTELKEFEAMRKQFEQAREIGAILSLDTSQKNFEAFFNLLSSKIAGLKEGQTVFFQGGWEGRTGGTGHAISYEIVKEQGDRLTFRIFNRGEGLDNHKQAVIAGKTAFLPLTEIVHIPVENFLRTSVIKGLYDLRHSPPQNHKWKPEELYNVLLLQLQGEMSNKIYTPEQLMEDLAIGNCSYLSLTALTFHHLQNLQLYKRWEYELQISTLWGFFQKYKDVLHKSEKTLHLLQKSSEQMARTAREAFYMANAEGRSIISLAEWEYTNQKIAAVQEAVKKAEQKYFEENGERLRPSFKYQKPEVSWETSNAVFQAQPTAERDGIANVTAGAEFYKPSGAQAAVKTLQEELEKSIHTIATLAQTLRTKEAIQNTVLNLSIENIKYAERIDDETYIRHQTRAVVAEMIEKLNALGKDFLWTCMKMAAIEPERAQMTRPSDYLTMVKLITLVNELNREYAKDYPDLCVMLPDLYQWDMGFILDGRSGASHLCDPRWENEMLILRDIWLPNEKKPEIEKDLSFFGLERFPASTYFNPSMHQSSYYRHFHEKDDVRQGYWDGEIKWQDVEWAVKWIARPEIAKKIAAYSPGLAKQSPYVQATYFLSNEWDEEERRNPYSSGNKDIRPQIFPASFLALRDLSFAADFIMKNRMDSVKILSGAERKNGFLSHALFFKDRSVLMSQLQPFVKSPIYSIKLNASEENTDKDPRPKEQKPKKHEGTPISPKFGPYSLDGGQFLRFFQGSLPASLECLYLEESSKFSPMGTKVEAAVPFRRRMEPHAQLHLAPQQVHAENRLSQEETREITALSALPKRQTIETLGYFRRNMGLLREPGYQGLFNKLMFEPPLLLKKLRDDHRDAKQFLQQLSDFCRDGRQLFEKLGDLPTVGFFLEAGHFFTEAAETAKKSNTGKTPEEKALFASILPENAFPDALAELASLLKRPTLSESDRTSLNLNLLQILSTRDSLAEENVSDLIAASIWVARTPDKELMTKTKALRDLAFRFQPEIYQALDKDQDLLLNAVASRVLDRPIATQWKKEELLYASQDGTLRIDPLLSRFLEYTGPGTGPLPYHLKEGMVYNATHLEYGRQTEPGVFEGTNSKNETFKITISSQGGPIVYRKIGEKWCRHLDQPPESLPLVLHPYSFWMVDSELTNAEYYSWHVSSYPSRTIWVTDPKTGELLYEINAKLTNFPDKSGGKISYKPNEIHRVTANGDRYGLILANPFVKDDFLSFLKGKQAFEAEGGVLAWINEAKSALFCIDLPRFGLKFRYKLDLGSFARRLECEQMQGYSIAKEQYVPSLGDITHYIVLENAEEKKVVLFPQLPLQKLEQGSLITDTAPDRPEDNNPIPYLTFDLKEGQCIPRAEEGRLYLAMLKLWEHEYKAASQHLSGLGAHIRPYSQEELEILDWIIDLKNRNHDNDPKALAVRFQAGLLRFTNKIDFGKGLDLQKDSEFMNKLAALATDIVQKRDQIPASLLPSPKDEELLYSHFQSFKIMNDNLHQRLDQMHGKPLDKTEGFPIKPIDSKNNWQWMGDVTIGSLQDSWEKDFDGTSHSLMYSSGLSTGFSTSYRDIFWLGELKERNFDKRTYEAIVGANPPSDAKSREAAILEKMHNALFHQKPAINALSKIEKNLWSEMYQRVLGLVAPQGMSTEVIQKEALLGLEIIVRGTSDPKEKVSAAVLLALYSDPAEFISPEWFDFLLKNNMKRSYELLALANLPYKIAGFLNKKDKSGMTLLNSACINPAWSFLNNLPLKTIPIAKGLPLRIPLGSLKNENPEVILPNYEECAAIPSSGQTDLPKLPYNINIQTGTQEGIAALSKELAGVFTIPIVDNIANSQIRSLQEDIKRFAASQSALRPNFEICSMDELRKTRGNLLVLVEQQKGLLATTEKDMLELANKDFSRLSQTLYTLDPRQEQQRRVASLENGDYSLIQPEELLYLFASQDVDKLIQRNHALTKEDVREVYTLAQKFLLESSTLRYLKKMLELMQKYETNIDTYESNVKDLEKLNKLKPDLEEVNKKWQADQNKNWFWKAGDFALNLGVGVAVGTGGATACLTAVTNPASAIACAIALGGGAEIGAMKLFEDNYYYSVNDYHKLYDKHGLPRVSDYLSLAYPYLRIPELEAQNTAFLQDRPFLLREIAGLERLTRAYDPAQHPEYLVGEYFGDIFLRKEQVDSLEQLDWRGGRLDELGSAQEFIMGFGKTSVLLPLIALRNADGMRIPVLVMPDTLIASMSQDLQTHLKHGFDQLIEVFDFKRDPRLGMSELQRIESRLLSAQKEKKAVLMSGSSLQTFALLFIERFSEFADPELAAGKSKELSQELDIFRRIFSLLKSSGDITMDEMDSLLDVLKAHHFTWGDPVEMQKDIVDTTAALFEALTTDPTIQGKLQWNFDSASTTGKPFTQLNYEEIARPLLIEKIMAGSIRPDILGQFLTKTSKAGKDLVKAYLMGKPELRDQAQDFVSKTDSAVRNTLAILKEQIHQILPLTAKKQVDEHYGAIPQGVKMSGNSKFMAIPYHGSNNPIVGSQFGTDLEILNYTLQLYLQKGIGVEIVKKRLEELKDSFLMEGKPLGKSVSYAEFIRMGGKKNMNFLHLQNNDFEQITDEVNKNRKIQFELLRKYILPDLKTYPNQLKTNGQIFALLGKRIKGCSGTLWNHKVYPPAIGRVDFSETEAKTLLVLWENSKEKESFGSVVKIDQPPQKTGIRSTLEPLYKEFSGSFIDLGGIFRGLDNQAVATEILSLASAREPKIRGIVYYDTKGEKKVLIQGREKQPVTESESGLSSNELCAFWDQKHTTGSDIKLSPDMQAYLSVSRHTMMRDLLQAAWRLRGLDKGQRVIFASLDEEQKAIAEILQKNLKKPSRAQISLQDVFLYAKYTEALRQGQDNFRALSHKLDAVLMKPVVDLLLDLKHSWDTLKGYKSLVTELFGLTQQRDPFLLYGTSERTIHGTVAVEEEKKRVNETLTLKKIRSDPIFREKADLKKIQLDIERIAAKTKEFVPNEVRKKGTSATETEVHVESQLEANTQQEEETKTQSPPLQTTARRDVVLWPIQRCFSKGYFEPTSKTQWGSKQIHYHKIGKNLSPLTQLLPDPDILKDKVGDAPLVSVDLILKRPLAKAIGIDAKSFFDARLLASLNYMPVYPEKGSQAPYEPFDEHQEICRHALVIRNVADGNMKYVMLGAWDALQWEQILKNDRSNPNPHQTEVSLLHFDLGVIAIGSSPVAKAALDGENFHRLQAQAKFVSGEINHYSDKEWVELEKWIKIQGAENLFKIFDERILAWREASKALFPRSALGNLFHKLGVARKSPY